MTTIPIAKDTLVSDILAQHGDIADVFLLQVQAAAGQISKAGAQ